MLEELQREQRLQREYPQRFLAAWKKGIELAGQRYFTGNIFTASNKWDLVPNYLAIDKVKAKLPRGEMLLLAAMYAFYDSVVAQVWLTELGCPNLCDISQGLDTTQQAIIAELFITYRGW